MSRTHSGGRRIAYFGGSFDPPHDGHLAVARAAREALGLNEVLFAPVGLQPLKPEGSTASFEDRVAMTKLAIADEPSFQISLADAPNANHEPNYTIDTLDKLRLTFPPATELFLILGADAFRQLSHWRRAAEMPFAASLIVVSRPGEDLSGLESYLPDTLRCELLQRSAATVEYRIQSGDGELAALYLLARLHVDISATELREQIHALADPGHPGDSLPRVAPRVLEYIREHGLYREQPPTAV